MNKIEELMVIMAEECNEVAVECSKVIRFANQDGRQPQLEREIGDLMCMYELVVEAGLVDPDMVSKASAAKREKLKKWSDLNV
jgi:NTP pyrophosphatase (non-canonical NTP hydrolase)